MMKYRGSIVVVDFVFRHTEFFGQITFKRN